MIDGIPQDGLHYAVSTCPHCGKIVVFLIEVTNKAFTDLEIFSNPDIRNSPLGRRAIPKTGLKIVETQPPLRRPQVPEHLPDRVAAKMLEAENSFTVGHAAAAAIAYRATIERAMQDMFPDDKGTLNARIRRAETEKRLPQAMIDWLDEVRAFGNDAAHGDLDATPADAEAARDFANLFLTYAYTMPKRVKMARAKRAAAKAG